MKIVLPGGSGQVGTLLARTFHADGHEVVVLSRPPGAPPPANPPRSRASSAGTAAPSAPWAAELDGADAVINLAGRSVNCRYTPANRRLIMDSRVDSTRIVGRGDRPGGWTRRGRGSR